MAARIDSLHRRAEGHEQRHVARDERLPRAHAFRDRDGAWPGAYRSFPRTSAIFDKDVAELDAFITAMLDYAGLERAGSGAERAEHDLTLILPGVASRRSGARRGTTSIRCEVSLPPRCARHGDAHLMETVAPEPALQRGSLREAGNSRDVQRVA